MKYLLVGGSGFISANFQNYLKAKKILYNKLSSKKYDLLKKSSFKKLNLFKGKDYNVIFFSAITPDKGKDYLTFKKNILMLSNFLENFPKEKIAHFNYISSDAVYSLKQTSIDENTQCSPDDLYGSMHLSREKIVESYFGNSKNFTLFRPTLIYGKGDTHSSYGPNRFFKQVTENNKIILFGKGLDTRDHIHIDDVVKLIYKISKKNNSGIFNLATGKSNNFLSIAKNFQKLNKNIKIELLPNNNLPSKRNFNIRKIKFFQSSFIKINDGIKKYF